MGRRGNMRSRPGLLFIIIFAVCLAIVYFSWRSMSLGSKVKETYSAHVETLLDESNKWRNAHEHQERESHDEENRDRDPDYDLGDVEQKTVAPTLRQFEMHDNKAVNNKQDAKKLQMKSIGAEVLDTDKGFYFQPNGLIAEGVKSMERFVHLDLKGAAPKMKYFKEFIPLVRKLGATGLLIEYEDMFPYTGSLRHISAKNAYSLDDIKQLLELANLNNLKVMPLIQTFGHMEFVLKYDQYRNLRESTYTPQVIDITKNASYSVISEIVKQVLNAHPDATHMHIGCDEVYELGKGNSGIEMQKRKLTEPQLFLEHIQRVATIVRTHNGRKVIPVIWDDELRKIPLQDIENSKLPSLVEIMVWHYTRYVAETITSEVWDKYAKVFKSVWIASAFKGSTGPRQLFTEPQYHIQNHFSWLDVIAANKQQLTFKGVALTGWQRYDHFATLCELLPVSIPSLAVCLATMANAGFTKDIHIATGKLIACDQPIEMTFPQIDKITQKAIVTQDCRFPGHELYHAVQELYGYKEGFLSITHRVDGWLTDYHVTHHFSNPGQLRVLSKSLTKQSSGLSMVSNPLKKFLASIYFDDTVDEWMSENIIERQKYNEKLQEKIQSLVLENFWPQRPLPEDISKKKSTLNETHDVKNVDQTKNAPPVLDALQNRYAEYMSKQYVQNQTVIKPIPQIQSKSNLRPNQFESSLKSKIPNESTNLKEAERRDLIPENRKFLKSPERRLNRNQSVDKKRSDGLLENNNENNRKSIDNPKQQSNSIDGGKRDSFEFDPEILRPTKARGIQNQQESNRDKQNYRPQNEGGKMRRGKYNQNVKNNVADDKDEHILKFSKSLDSKGPQKATFDNDFSFKKQESGKEFTGLKKEY